MVWWALSAASLVWGAVGLVASVRQSDWQSAGLNLLFWVLSAVSFAVGLRDYRESRRRYVTQELAPQIWQYDAPYDTWQELGDGRRHAIYSPELNRRLAADDPIRVSVDGEWQPRSRATDHYKRLPKQESKYRLASDLLGDSDSVRFQKTDYAAFRVTNRLAYAHWWDTATDVPGLTFEDVERSGTLPVLARSNCSNHIGGDILAIGEGALFLQRQKQNNGMYPGLWVASASGSFDLADKVSDRLQDLVKTGLLRELEEEMGLPPRQVPSLADTKVIGYARATYLGGKPQFYGVCRIGDVQPRPKDAYVDDFERLEFRGGAAGVMQVLREFAAAHPGELAPPLEMLIQVLEQWLRTDPGAAAWLWPHAAVPGTAATSD